MTDAELTKYRLAIKNSILHYLCDDWNNHKRGKAHKENQAIFDREDGYAIWHGTDLEMVMEKVVKGIWSVNIEDIGVMRMTNADRIRNMGNWELAEFIYNVSNGATKISVCEEECAKCEYTDGYCTYQIGEWLISE